MHLLRAMTSLGPSGNGHGCARASVRRVRSGWVTVLVSLVAAVLLAACAEDPSPDVEDPPDDAQPDDGRADDTRDPDAGGATDPPDPDSDPAGDDQAAPPEPADPSQPDDPAPDLSVALELVEVASMSAPIAGAVGPDGTLYLAEREGTVHPLTTDGIGEAVVDISDQTSTESERGLLGIAFSPAGDELYLSSTDLDGNTRIAGVAIVDGRIRADEQRDIFTLTQPQGNHNGGDIAIGPDGLLYIAIGDGGGSGDPQEAGQDLTTALGSLLRIDPTDGDTYAVPDDNPFVGDTGAEQEIFSYGLRNPWRFSFDHDTDELWIADVGQSGREEINRVDLDVANGANFGWNLMEGTTEFTGPAPDGHVAPVYEYDTGGDEGCAIVGGYVYRGATIEELNGVYLYADFCAGAVRGLHVDDDGTVLEQAELGIDAGGVLSFAQDVDGEVYVLTDGGGVFRIALAD